MAKMQRRISVSWVLGLAISHRAWLVMGVTLSAIGAGDCPFYKSIRPGPRPQQHRGIFFLRAYNTQTRGVDNNVTEQATPARRHLLAEVHG